MTNRLSNYLLRRLDEEEGNASVEFMIVVPIFLILLMMTIELGFITIRHTLIERGLDIAVRQIRLGTGEPSSHAEIKTVICENASFINNCDTELRLEMMPVDMRAYATLDPQAKCKENAEPVDPAILKKEFVFGGVNELMVLRACYLYEPIFPEAVLGQALEKDGNGKARIIKMTAFVQEPT